MRTERTVRYVNTCRFGRSLLHTQRSVTSSKLPHLFKYSCPPSTATAPHLQKLSHAQNSFQSHCHTCCSESCSLKSSSYYRAQYSVYSRVVFIEIFYSPRSSLTLCLTIFSISFSLSLGRLCRECFLKWNVSRWRRPSLCAGVSACFAAPT